MVGLTVQRPGEPDVRDVAIRLDKYRLPIELERTSVTATRLAALIVLSFYPIPFLIVASVVLIQRYYDRHAWVLAVLFGGFIAAHRSAEPAARHSPNPAKAAPSLLGALAVVPPGALYCFFASFPEVNAPGSQGALVETSVARASAFRRGICGQHIIACGVAAQPVSRRHESRLPRRFRIRVWELIAGYGLGLASLV